MEVNQSLSYHHWDDSRKMHYIIYTLTFKGTDTQRLGDLISCPICRILLTKSGLMIHFEKIHGIDPDYLPKIQMQQAKSTAQTPTLGWYLVDVIPSRTKYRFRVICKDNQVVKDLINCSCQSEVVKYVETNIGDVITDMVFFEKFIAYTFKKYLGSKEDDQLIEPKYPYIEPKSPYKQSMQLETSLKLKRRPSPVNHKQIYHTISKGDSIYPPFNLASSEILRCLTDLGCLDLKTECDSLLSSLINPSTKRFYRLYSPGIPSLVAGIIHHVSQKNRRVILLDDLPKVSGVKRIHFTRTSRRICRHLKIKIPYLTSLDYLNHFASELGISSEHKLKSVRLIEQLTKSGALVSKSPSIVSLAIIHITSKDMQIKTISGYSAIRIQTYMVGLKSIIEHYIRKGCVDG